MQYQRIGFIFAPQAFAFYVGSDRKRGLFSVRLIVSFRISSIYVGSAGQGGVSQGSDSQRVFDEDSMVLQLWSRWFDILLICELFRQGCMLIGHTSATYTSNILFSKGLVYQMCQLFMLYSHILKAAILCHYFTKTRQKITRTIWISNYTSNNYLLVYSCMLIGHTSAISKGDVSIAYLIHKSYL